MSIYQSSTSGTVPSESVTQRVYTADYLTYLQRLQQMMPAQI
jgi:hypothetical protein